MTKDEAVILLCEHFSEGMVRTIVDAIAKDEALRLALEALEADELAMIQDKDGHMVYLKDQAITTIKAALEAKDEPFEYWNAVEGWVKLDEVREHFESVNCGTIYKNGGEGRVPLYTAPQRTWVGLTDEQILHFVDTHVGAPSMDYPLDNSDWINFARAIEAAHGIKETP